MDGLTQEKDSFRLSIRIVLKSHEDDEEDRVAEQSAFIADMTDFFMELGYSIRRLKQSDPNLWNKRTGISEMIVDFDYRAADEEVRKIELQELNGKIGQRILQRGYIPLITEIQPLKRQKG